MPINFKNNSSQLSVSQSENNNNTCGMSDAQMHTESISKKIRMSPEFMLQDKDPESTSIKPSPLGLKLARTPSFLSNLGKMSQENKPKEECRGSGSFPAKRKAKGKEEKLKAGNFPATCIKLGAWQRMASHAGDLVVKLYYAKRKLVWEILEGPLKNKMEIQWSDICAIRALTPENEPGLLEIELTQPPVYYRETFPQPRKHTIWQQSPDFTCGQASIWRRHLVIFPPGILGQNYEQLLQCDVELNAISKKPFPKYDSPYFDPCIFETTLSFSGHGANKVAHYPYQAYPTTIPREPFFTATPVPCLSVLDLPFTYQGGGGNHNFVAHTQASWEQNSSIPRDNFDMYGTFGISSTSKNAINVYDSLFRSTSVNNVCDPMFPSTTNINNVYDPMLPSTTNFNNVHGHMFHFTTNDDNVYDPLYYDLNASGLQTSIRNDYGDTLLETTGSINSLLQPLGVNNINEASYQPGMAFHAMSGDQGNNYDVNGMISDSIHWLAAQGSSENMFQGSNEGVFQGWGKDVLESLSKDML